jgi:two-component system nitrate/nitrite response regulator NarL
MECGRNILVSVGLDPLYQEMLASALSIHGWRVMSFEQEQSHCETIPEIVLVSASPDPEAVISNVRKARAVFPSARIVLLGAGTGEPDLIRLIGEGVCAYLPRDKGITDLINTLEMVRNNRTPSSSAITQMVLGSISRLSREQHGITPAPLTERENEVLYLIIDGLSNKEIADRLSIAPSTVKNHVHHLLEKLNVGSRHEAAWVSSRRPVQSVRFPVRSIGEV